MRLLVFLALFGLTATAGEFKDYTWRVSFLMGGGYYQPTLKVAYNYNGGDDDVSVLAIPRDANLHLQKMTVKVDGKKSEPSEVQAVTWWSAGKKVPVFQPAMGKKVKVEALYVIKNMFLIPPGPTDLPIGVKKLEVGFAPLNKFEFSGKFVGKAQKFGKPKRIPHKPGEPSGLSAFTVKNVKANGGNQGLFFLVPKKFAFSFNLLRGTTASGSDVASSGSIDDMQLGGGTPGAGDADMNSGDLKTYTMVFYSQNPGRDWTYVPTWIQQERTYLPHGILPGGRVETRTLFKGAGDKTDDLMPWQNAKSKSRGDAVGAPQKPTPQALELFLKDWRASVEIDPDGSRYIAYEDGGKVSPALANQMLASELSRRFTLTTAPAFSTGHPQNIAASLPLSGFDGVLTGINVGGRWFMIDAADASWGLRNSAEKLKGRNVVILGQRIEMAGF